MSNAVPLRPGVRAIGQEDVVSEFLSRSLNAARASYAAANRLDQLDRVSTCVSTIGGAIITLLGAYALGAGEGIGPWFNSAVFVLGAVISLTALAQNVFKWKERAIHHRQIGGRYADAMRRLELIVSQRPIDVLALTDWSAFYTTIGECAALVPPGIWRKSTQ